VAQALGDIDRAFGPRNPAQQQGPAGEPAEPDPATVTNQKAQAVDLL
jgi:hypothetical protein